MAILAWLVLFQASKWFYTWREVLMQVSKASWTAATLESKMKIFHHACLFMCACWVYCQNLIAARGKKANKITVKLKSIRENWHWHFSVPFFFCILACYMLVELTNILVWMSQLSLMGHWRGFLGACDSEETFSVFFPFLKLIRKQWSTQSAEGQHAHCT